MSFANAEIKLLRARYLRGPNVWTFRSAMEVWVDLGILEQYPSHTIPGLNERLTSWLPALSEHHCGVGEPGGFLQRLRDGTWCGHVLEHVVIELLNLAGMPTGFGQTRSTSQPGVYRMVFRARDENVARVALAQGHALLTAAIRGDHFDVPAAVTSLREAIDKWYLGPSTAAIVAAATERKIPHIRLNDGNLVQLGHGARQHRIWTAETDRTGAIAESIAGDKDLTKSLLQAAGVPVPQGRVVADAAEAWEAAQDIGLPVVVKPSDANHGRGVSLELTDRAEIERAFSVADAEGSEVMVERFIAGHEHRLLVVGGRVVAAVRGESLWITGDGVHTVQALIDQQLNSDPRRGEAEEFPLETIRLEREPVMRLLLERQDLTASSVPSLGQRVLVQRNGNMAFDCTDEVHPEVAYTVALASKVVGLDIAGIDLVTSDISQPLQATGGAVVEVNAGPGLLMHLRPAIGQPRPVGEAVVEHLFPIRADEPHPGRIPLVGVAGTRGATTIARTVAWLAQLSGLHTGLVCAQGVYLDNRRIQAPGAELQRDYWAACQRVLMNRDLICAVFENGPAMILDDGLPYDRCQVGVVTDLGGWEHLSRHDVHGIDAMPRVLRTQMDVVLTEGVGVLNGDDEQVSALAEFCDGEVVLYGRLEGGSPSETVTRHLSQDGRAAVCDGELRVHLYHGRRAVSSVLIDLRCVLDRHPQRERPELSTALTAAVAAAWALGLAPELINAGLETLVLPLA